ncbi:MAG: OmpA family protein, partial [Gammaproteobacteria bacterium]|nr:OmpA family protein [Gammaproteobacteria bacterium]
SSEGNIIGVRSTNGAPFRLYTGVDAPRIVTECSKRPPPSLGCNSIVHGIQFDFDSAMIKPESSELLDTLFSNLKSATTSGITIIGHTSSEGSDKYNEQLSRRRAEAVVTALVTRGINTVRISALGRGEKEPIARNSTDAGRSLNRRVEIKCK